MQDKEIQELARQKMGELGYVPNTIAKLAIEYRQNTTRLGTCYKKKMLIRFSKKIFTMPDLEAKDLIAHEVAHFKGHHHNKTWRRYYYMLGGSPQFSRPIKQDYEDVIAAGLSLVFREES